MNRTIVAILAALALLIVAPHWAHACPGCANALNGAVGRGFNASIYFMIAMPFTVVGVVAVGIVLLNRRVRQSSHRAAPVAAIKQKNEEAVP